MQGAAGLPRSQLSEGASEPGGSSLKPRAHSGLVRGCLQIRRAFAPGHSRCSHSRRSGDPFRSPCLRKESLFQATRGYLGFRSAFPDPDLAP